VGATKGQDEWENRLQADRELLRFLEEYQEEVQFYRFSSPKGAKYTLHPTQ